MSKPLTVEIHGTGTHNRGAELMAIAIADRLRAEFQDVRIVVPMRFGNVFDRCKYQFYTTAEFGGRIKGRAADFLMDKMFNQLCKPFGLVHPDEIDIVLDASGFAFSDQWGYGQAKNLYQKMCRPSRKNKKLILLPQALGTFNIPQVAEAAKRLFNRASLIFARDSKSYESTKSLLGEGNQIYLSPDFTLNVEPLPDPDIHLPDRFVAIVPNYRMIDKGNGENEYLSFLEFSISKLKEMGSDPHFLLHDSASDFKVVSQLSERGINIPVITHHDPRVLKFVLGKSRFVIGSRFHALVSALSQGVPCIGTGWSHKYPELFKDFDCSELLLENIGDFKALDRLIINLNDENQAIKSKQRIIAGSNALKESNKIMWQRVIAQMGQF